MNGFIIDIALCLFTYTLMMAIILWKNNRRRPSDDSNDDDGGIAAWTGPDLDLPPGVCLPKDGPVHKKEVDEVLI